MTMKKIITFLVPVIIVVTLAYFYNQKKLEATEDFDSIPLKSDTTRYLAHAGGEINGQRYTNSLEALNLNYSNGFRIFEIDIITTTDGHLVCAHDWDSWK